MAFRAAAKPAGPKYSGQQVDEMIVHFEKCCQRQESSKHSAVRLRAAERDLLKSAEALRDIILLALRSDKTQLMDVFGGSCTRLWRLHSAIESVEFSDGNIRDRRWQNLQDGIATVEEVLENFGRFKPWRGVQKPPESLAYSLIVNRLTPGESIELHPLVTGCEIAGLTFTSEPMLPYSLELRNKGGDITGHLLPGVDVPERTYTITAENLAGSAKCSLTFCVRDSAPENLSYVDVRPTCFTGDLLILNPRHEGGSPHKWSIEPELPAGVEFDKKTGKISGRPKAPGEETTYTITGRNSDGAASCTIKFKVQIAPPAKLSYPEVIEAYPEMSHVLPMGAVAYLTPEIELHKVTASLAKVAKWGRVFATSGTYVGTKWGRARQAVVEGSLHKLAELPKLNFKVVPELPKGIAISSKTGVISGQPEDETPSRAYTITCSNEGGSTSCQVRIAVKMLPPVGLKYPEAKEVLWTGVPLTLEPEISGLVEEWTVTPDLPEGLLLNTQMGSIGGMPTKVMPQLTYTVTASNSKGQATSMLEFSIMKPAPKNLQYRSFHLQYALNRYMEILRPSVDGQVDIFTVKPDLPEGLTLDPNQGDIKGTPTKEAAMGAYEVTAENDTGMCRITLTFAIQLLPPSDIVYRVDDQYGIGQTITLEPEYNGGGSTWEVDPPLPEGISLAADTGVISGSFTAQCAEANYTITASNEAGGSSSVISFMVVPEPPSDLSYPEVPSRENYIHKFVIGEAITLEPKLGQAFGAKFKIDRDLPVGLTFDEETGVISGTPTVQNQARVYTVSASNVSGGCEVKLRFQVLKLDEKGKVVTQSFAQMLEEITDIKDMPPNPTPDVKGVDWQLWMTHRVALNDPELTVLDFNHVRMPPPHQEPRIAPKLMKALTANEFITGVKLQSANLQKPQGAQLADVLRRSKTISLVDISGNHLDSERMEGLANALIENDDTSVSTLRVMGQVGVPDFGRRTEQRFAEMVQKRKTITKLNFDCKDPHWLNTINRAVMANVDAERRARRGGLEDKKDPALEKAPKMVERNLAKLFIDKPPDQAVWEVFEDDDMPLSIARSFISQKNKLPKSDQLQKFAQKQGTPLQYKQIAPLIMDVRKRILTSLINSQVYCFEGTAQFLGTLAGYTEKNSRYAFELLTKSGKIQFNATSDPTIEVSVNFAQWILPDMEDERETRWAPDGAAYTRAEFIEYFGHDVGIAKWNDATPAGDRA